MKVVIGELIPENCVPKALSPPAIVYFVPNVIPVCKVIKYSVKLYTGKSKNGRNGAGLNSIDIAHRLSQRELKNENKIEKFKEWSRFPYIENLTERKKITLPVYSIEYFGDLGMLSEKPIYRDFFDTRIDCVV